MNFVNIGYEVTFPDVNKESIRYVIVFLEQNQKPMNREENAMQRKMPAIFIGHGSPENAFEDTVYSKQWAEIAKLLPRPKAVVAISAHWTNHTDAAASVTSAVSNEKPETIHDFYGFPEHFYDFSYGAPGSPELARRILETVQTTPVRMSNHWGLDHGAWSVLANMYPEADIPVVQLSIDENLPRKNMFDVGQELRMLREDGILILGSGNIVHNLRAVRWGGEPFDWAVEFDAFIRRALLERNIQTVIDFEEHPLAQYVLPTVEHFLPLLYVLGATAETEDPKFFTEDIFAASVGMRSVVFG